MTDCSAPEVDYDRDRLQNELRVLRALLKAQGEELREARRELAELRARLSGALLRPPAPVPDGGGGEGQRWAGEERYRLLFESLREVVFLNELVTDPQGRPCALRVLDANRAALELLGLPRERVLGLGLDELFPELAPELVTAALRSALTGERAALGEHRSATGRWLQSYAYSPQPRQVALVALDITERKLVELALQKSERSLAEAQHIARIGRWEWDMRSGEGRWSDELYAIYGLDPRAFTPTVASFAACVHPEDLELVQRMLRRSLTLGAPVDFDFRIVRGDGDTRILNCVGEVALKDDLGRPRLMVGIKQDITERKRVEEALRESEERFRKIFEQGPLGALIVDLDYRLVKVNRRFCDLLGYSPQELCRLSFVDLTHPDDLAPTLLHPTRLIEGSASHFSLEKRYLHKDGHAVWVTVTVWLMRDRGGAPSYFISTVEDISEKKRLQERIISSAKRDERAKSLKTIQDYQKRLSQLASKLSLAQEEERRRIAVEVHDSIGQNLAFCKLKVGRLQLQHAEAGAGLGEVLDTIDRCITASRSLSFELSPAVLFDLGLEPALEWLARLHAARHPLAITLSGTSGLDLPLPSRILLFQAAREFIANVVKHSGAAHAEIRLSAQKKSVNLAVHDDGAGFLVPRRGSVPDASSGFGLFSIQEQLRNAGGSLEIASRPGAGTTAQATLPLAPAARRRKP